MCVQVTKTANRFEIRSLLEKILLKQVGWCLTFNRTVYYSVGYNNCKYMTKNVPELYETFVGFYDKSKYETDLFVHKKTKLYFRCIF